MAIKDICKLVNGDAYKDADWSKTGTPIIRIQNLNDSTKPFNYWAGSLHDRVRVSNGDLLFAWSGTPGTSFGAHVWRGEDAVLNQHIFRIDEDSSIVDREWLAEAFNYVLDEIIDKSHGGVGLRHITKRKLEEICLPVIPLPMQRKTVAALQACRLAIDEAHSCINRVASDIDALMLQARSTALGPGVRLPDDQTPAPKGWEWRTLCDIAQLESGHTPSRRMPEWWGGDVPWLALPDIRELDGAVANKTAETTNAEGLANSSARLLPQDTVCLSRTASVGFVTVLGKPMATSQDFVNWICGPDLHPWFLAEALIASRDYLRSLSSGAIHKTIYMPTLRALTLCLPKERHVQAEISKATRSGTQILSAAKTAIEAQVSEIALLRLAALRAAFSEPL